MTFFLPLGGGHRVTIFVNEASAKSKDRLYLREFISVIQIGTSLAQYSPPVIELKIITFDKERSENGDKD